MLEPLFNIALVIVGAYLSALPILSDFDDERPKLRRPRLWRLAMFAMGVAVLSSQCFVSVWSVVHK